MSIKVKARCISEKFGDGDFKIFWWTPLQIYDELKVNPKGMMFSTKGNDSYITEGKDYELELEEISFHKIYGGTYKIIDVPSIKLENVENLTLEESRVILEEITTSSQTDNLLKAYPNFVFKALYEGVESFDISTIHNVGEYRLNSYVRNLTTKYRYLSLVGKIKDYGCDVSDCGKLFAEYKEEDKILDALQKTPYYVLIRVLKRSFLSTDKLLMEIREDLKESEQRCEFIVLTTLELNENGDNDEWFKGGDTKLTCKKMWDYSKNYAPEVSGKMLDVCKKSDLIYFNEKTKDLACMSTYLMEKNISQFTKRKISNPTKWNIDWTRYKEIKDGILTDEQSEILHSVCDNDITVVNAKGGTGKTSAVMAIIKMLEDNHKSYMLLSPTGRVASRIKEQTGREARTIHMACLMGEIDVDFLLIEEYSMVGVELLNMLIMSITNPNCKLLFNGHLGQITPISCGCPMRDMIKSGVVPTLSLSKVFRYGEGGLYKMATDADDGKFYIKDLDYNNKDRISIGTNKDYTYVRYNGEVDQVIDEYKRFLDRKIKPIDISIVTLWNITEFGSINLNNKIQEIVNPITKDGDYVEVKIRGYDVMFKVHDIILNTKNCYDILTLDGYELIKKDRMLSKEDVPHAKVMNGETGKIVDIDNGYIIAKFGEELLVFDKLKQRELLLAYSLTSYKLQGSENPYIISLITPQFKKSLSKNIIYTDMSRARKEVVEIIDPITLEEAIKIDTTDNRITNLKEMLLDEL